MWQILQIFIVCSCIASFLHIILTCCIVSLAEYCGIHKDKVLSCNSQVDCHSAHCFIHCIVLFSETDFNSCRAQQNITRLHFITLHGVHGRLFYLGNNCYTMTTQTVGIMQVTLDVKLRLGALAIIKVSHTRTLHKYLCILYIHFMLQN